MPYVTSTNGLVVFVAALAVFVVQEFSHGFGTPQGAPIRDDRWSLIYLDALPVALVSVSVLSSFVGWGAWPASRTVFVVGIVVLILGVVLRQWSHIVLGRFHQAVVTIHLDHELVTTGPYRHLRHPMYTGSSVAFLGVGLALGTWPSLVLSFLGTMPAILRRILVEERAMAESLGRRYHDYARHRARLVPWVW
jgi:protein-S-isoprenylcysteine O-methyltransferase Ste14